MCCFIFVHHHYLVETRLSNLRSGNAGDEKAEERAVRLFHDDTFKGFFRRLAWSIDGT